MPWVNEVMVFEDLFLAGLHMPPHPVSEEILHKFCVQLHSLTPNAIIQIGKFIWEYTVKGANWVGNVAKGVFESTIGTLLDIPSKTKDGLRALRTYKN
jgi:hypothetical protein